MIRHWWVAGAALLCTNCRTLDRFDTTGDAAYCGSIVSAQFVRQGFPPDMRMRLELDMSQWASRPGTITTDDAVSSPCAGKPRFDNAVMRASDEVQNDVLSTLDFGTGRDENLVVWVESTCDGPVLGVVSLMKNDTVEVRLLKPPPADGGEAPAGFALFQLTRRSGDCGI
ncbi:MAG: hypothetical protein R3B13_07205 [Polyangiaceae bacterium]